jgi:hypothetical protein
LTDISRYSSQGADAGKKLGKAGGIAQRSQKVRHKERTASGEAPASWSASSTSSKASSSSGKATAIRRAPERSTMKRGTCTQLSTWMTTRRKNDARFDEGTGAQQSTALQWPYHGDSVESWRPLPNAKTFLHKGCAVLLTKSERGAKLRGYACQNKQRLFGEKFVSRLEAQWQFGH